ncbi:MAG: molybdenum cofactor guanylyltransferase [Desulfurobacteriaceae bacterium]
MLTVCILAGGKSKRFKKDKLFQNLFGKPLISYVIDSVKELGEVIVVGKPSDKFLYLKDVAFIPESFKDHSPLYGIITGLRNASFEKVLFLPGDVPFIKKEVLKAFSKEAPPCVISEGNFLHSLFFLASKVHLPFVEEFLKRGNYRISDLHGFLSSKRLDFRKLEILDYRRRSLLNINRQEEFYEAIY